MEAADREESYILHQSQTNCLNPLHGSGSSTVGWEENRTYFAVGIKEGPAGNLLSRARAEQVLAEC